jgi:hypothetical protein
MARIDSGIEMGTRDRALNDCEILGLRAVALDGMVGRIRRTFTAVTYKPGSTPWLARRLTGRVLRDLYDGGKRHMPSPEVCRTHALKERAEIRSRRWICVCSPEQRERGREEKGDIEREVESAWVAG